MLLNLDDIAPEEQSSSTSPRQPVGNTDFDAYFAEAEATYGVPAELLRRQMMTESGGNPQAIGPETKYGKALGLMQFLPSTAKEIDIDPLDPGQAILGAAYKLRMDAEKRYNGDLALAVAAYHGGYDTKGWGPKTMAYVEKIFGQDDFSLVSAQTKEAAPETPVATEAPVPVAEEKGLLGSLNVFRKSLQQQTTDSLDQVGLEQNIGDSGKNAAIAAKQERQLGRNVLAREIGERVQGPASPLEVSQAEANAGRSVSGTVRDAALQLGQGIKQITAAPVSLVAPDSDLAQGMQRDIESIRAQKSNVTQAKYDVARANIEKAAKDGGVAEFKAALAEYGSDPALLQDIVMTTLPSMLGVMAPMKAAQLIAAARGVAPAAITALSGVVGGTSNAVLNAGSVRQEAYDTLYGIYSKEKGVTPEQAKEMALRDSLIPTTVGALAGYLGGKYGAESSLLGAKALLGKGGVAAAAKAGGAAVARELGTEQAEEVLPQLTTNSIASRVDGRNPTEGLGDTAAQTLIGAGPMSLAGAASEAKRAYDPLGNELSGLVESVEGTNFINNGDAIAREMLRTTAAIDPALTRKPTATEVAAAGGSLLDVANAEITPIQIPQGATNATAKMDASSGTVGSPDDAGSAGVVPVVPGVEIGGGTGSGASVPGSGTSGAMGNAGLANDAVTLDQNLFELEGQQSTPVQKQQNAKGKANNEKVIPLLSLPESVPAGPAGASVVTRGEAAAAEAIVSALRPGTRTEFVALGPDGPQYDGSTTGTDLVRLNVNAGNFIAATVAHEVGHVIENSGNDAWQRFEAAVLEEAQLDLTNDDGLLALARQYAPNLFTDENIGELSATEALEKLLPEIGYNRAMLKAELSKDVFGNAMMSKGFMGRVSAKLAKTDLPVLKEIIAALTKAINVLRGRKGRQNFDADKLIKNLERVRDEAANVVAVQLRVQNKTDAELKLMASTNKDPVVQQVVQNERENREQFSTKRTVEETYKDENRQGIIVGARPGEFDWTFSSDTTPPPIFHPVHFEPRVDRLGPALQKILNSKPAKQLIEDAFGVTNLKVFPTLGQYKGKPEPSFALYGDGLTFEAADGISRMLGAMFAQESTIVTQPVYGNDEDTWPAFYVGSGKKLTAKQIQAVRDAAQTEGLDYTTSIDGMAVKFFFDGSDIEQYGTKIASIAKAAGLNNVHRVRTRSQFNEAETYFGSETEGTGRQVWLPESGAGSSSLFGRAVDHLLVPYAKAVGAEGYRFSPDLYADRFGLSPQWREYIRSALRPANGKKLSTAGILAGTEVVEANKSDTRSKTPKSNNTDVMWALQNRSAAVGQIEPGDYSDEAKKAITEAIADEVIFHVSSSEGKSAIGWYDQALKNAKEIYDQVFPELKSDQNREMLFDAMLGIASQGNDVHSNSIYAGRMYFLVTRRGMTIGEAVKAMYGTFGGETRAIENNFLKLEELLDRNGYDEMRKLFNKKMTVGEWNAILRRDQSLYYKGKPQKVEGVARQKVNGWMIFGPKIGSFINNLHGDYSTLTADLWFSRTWNRILGFSFLHTPLKEYDKYTAFKDALIAEHTKTTEPKSVAKNGNVQNWEHGEDINYTDAELDALMADPEAMLALATELYDYYKDGYTYSHSKDDKKSGFSTKSDLRRAAKNWIEFRQDSVAVPRNDNERAFQQEVVEAAQKLIKRKTGNEITIADIQAALWYHEKDLFGHFGATDIKKEPADYADAAKNFMTAFNEGDLFYVAKPSPKYILGSKGDYLNGGNAQYSPTRSNAPGNERAGGSDAGTSTEVPRYGTGSPGAVSVQGFHYSQQGRASLDGRYYGTGAKGAEYNRVMASPDPRIKERIYFYVDAGKGITPEQFVGSVGHTTHLDNVYDANADTWLQAKLPRGMSDDSWTNAFESAVLDNGFDGYVSDFGTQRAAVLLGRHSVPVAQTNQKSGEVSQVKKAESVGDRLRKSNLPAGAMTGKEWQDAIRGTEFETDSRMAALDERADKWVYRDELAQYSPSRINVDGVERTVFNSNGKRIAQTEEGLRNFWRWFGDSKVVDAQGRPLVVYHGTNADISEFDNSKTVDGGFHFGTLEQASMRTSGAGKNLMPAYLSANGLQRSKDMGGNWKAKVRAAKLAGKDGIVYLNRYEGLSTKVILRLSDEGLLDKLDRMSDAEFRRAVPEAQDSYIVFSPTQIKSATGNRGTFDPNNPDIRYSPPRFISQLARSIESVPTKLTTQPAAQWKLWLAGNKAKLGVKDDEIQWSGINDYLDMRGKEKVTKDEILAYLNDNGVKVNDVLKGTSKDDLRDEISNALNYDGEYTTGDFRLVSTDDGYDLYRDGTFERGFRSERAAVDFVSEIASEDDATGGATTYDEYTLPGGRNYRELLITLPEKKRNVVRRLTDEEINAKNKEISRLQAPIFRGGNISEQDALRIEQLRSEIKNDLQVGTAYKPANFQSGHWRETNILAHIRMNSRTDADGAKVLFIEEIQSDWGQEGKKKGFNTQEPSSKRPANGEKNALLAEMREKAKAELVRRGGENPDLFMIDTAVNVSSHKQIAEWAGMSKEWQDLLAREMEWTKYDRNPSVPSAPFVTDTKSWVSLAVKRAIMWGVQNGFDKVAFVNGEQSAERYDLSKSIKEVQYRNGDLTAWDNSGKRVINEAVEEGSVEDYIGKDAAAKLLDPSAYDDEVDAQRISGLDLKVGGSGMKTFYDRILPQVVNDVLKKVGGGKMETVALSQELGDVFHSKEKVASNIERSEYESNWGDGYRFVKTSDKLEQPGFTITPAMKEKVSEGVPLFSLTRNQQPAWVVTPTAKVDNFIYEAQDKLVDLKRVREAIKESGAQLREQYDAYLAEELYHHRASYRVQLAFESEFQPILDEMKLRGITVKDFDKFLHARHAPERNAAMAKANPNQAELDQMIQDTTDALLKASGQEAIRLDAKLKALMNAKPYSGTEEQRQMLSGMSNKDAAAYLASLGNKRNSYEALGKRVDDLVEENRLLMEQYGLETPETVDGLRSAYKHYVPLMREMEDSDLLGTGGSGYGAGYSVRGSTLKRATGSLREVESIFSNLMAQREQIIVRGEKAMVGKALYGMVLTNPNPDFWIAIRPDMSAKELRDSMTRAGMDPALIKAMVDAPVESYLDEKTGVVKQRVNPMLARDEMAFVVRIGGQDRVVLFNRSNDRAVRLAQALKNEDMNYAKGPVEKATRGVGFMTRWISSVNTQYNPIFGMKNFIRDVQGAAINLSSTPIKGQEAKVLGNVFHALGTVFADERGWTKVKAGPEWQKYWTELQEEGGLTGYRDMFNGLEDRLAHINNMVDPGKLQKAWTKTGGAYVLQMLSDYNTAIESGIRLSAYRAAREAGMSKKAAASLAKNLTVNFNRKGRTGATLSGWYAFFNAAVQGNARIVETFKAGHKGKAAALAASKLIGAGVSLGATMTLLALAVMGDDWEDIPEYIREREIIIPLGKMDVDGDNVSSTKGGYKYLHIPMALGYHAIYSIGRTLVEMAYFRDKPGSRMGDLLLTVIEAGNPLGNSNSAAEMIAPSFFDPVLQLLSNENAFGRTIAKENYRDSDPIPAPDRFFKSASSLGKGVSKGLDWVSGGDGIDPGRIQVTPDQVDFVFGQITGGVGRESLKLYQYLESKYTGEKLPESRVPIKGMFYGETKSEQSATGKYYELQREVNIAERQLKARVSQEAKDAFKADNPEAMVIETMNAADRKIARLNKLRKKAEAEGDKAEVKRLEREMLDARIGVLDSYDAARKAQK